MRKYYSLKLIEKITDYILVVSDIWSDNIADANKKLQAKIDSFINDKNLKKYKIEVETISLFE